MRNDDFSSWRRRTLNVIKPKSPLMAVRTRCANVNARKKDPNAPKRALSAFFFFSHDRRPDVQQSHPDWKVGQVAQELGRYWKALTEEERQIYDRKALGDKERYAEEMRNYKATGKLPASRMKVVGATAVGGPSTVVVPLASASMDHQHQVEHEDLDDDDEDDDGDE